MRRRRPINQLQLLCEFSERQFVGERFVQCRAFDNILTGSRGTEGTVFRPGAGNQFGETYDIENPPEIIGERGQAELGANLLQPAHQKRTLVHPLLDRAKRVFIRLAALFKNVWPLRYAGLHSIQYGLVLETRYGAELIARALDRIGQSRQAWPLR